MFRRDKENRLDHEGLRRMREAIRQRLEQDEPRTAAEGASGEGGYSPSAAGGEGTYGYETLGGEAGYILTPSQDQAQGGMMTGTALPQVASGQVGWDAPATGGPTVTTVAVDTTWQGTLRSTADIRIEGTLTGEVETEQEVFIAPEATVDAIVRAARIIVAGQLNGQINCRERLEVRSSGRISGQIDAGAIVVHEGAFMGGQLRMTSFGQGQGAETGEDDGMRPMLQRVR